MGQPGDSDVNAASPELTMSVELSFASAGRPVPLAQWLLAADRHITGLTAETARLTGRVSELERTAEQRAHDQVAAATSELTGRADSLEHRVTDVDSRLDEILATLDELTVRGRQTEADIDHHSFQREFSSLVNQHIGTLVDLAVPRHKLSSRDRAIATSRLCWILFGTGLVLEEALFREIDAMLPDAQDRAVELCEAAKSLRDRVSGHHNQRWDFGFCAGSLIDANYQEEWPAQPGGPAIGPAERPVDFVVVPSYVVGNYSIISKQRVYILEDYGDGAPRSARAGEPDPR